MSSYKSKSKKNLIDRVDLLRGGQIVSTLTGAFGNSLRETRITAILGYLIAQKPEPFLKLFGFSGIVQNVSIETRHENGRSDILVETHLGTGLIEAKIDATDPLKQSQNYPARWRVLLTHYIPPISYNSNCLYLTWKEFSRFLATHAKSGSPEQRIFSNDLLGYLRTHRMIKTNDSVEIYAREINEPVTLELFLKARLYGCNYERGSKLGEALYFAPHFGKSITKEHPGINAGISYIARIESVGQATTWQQFQQLMKVERGSQWLKQHAELLKKLKQRWHWGKGKHRSFVLLGQPRLAFNPPVQKESLQKGVGWLSVRYCTFDDLFDAWQK